ncbi:MAG: rhomboid family intramembrane serine protease [Victivallales bacterium]|nr:rhomboid family intramembrane serine protease [Victivallales bacterium]
MLRDREYTRYDYNYEYDSRKKHSVLFKLIAVNVVVFLLCKINPDIIYYFSLDAGKLPQAWRVVTYMFLHGDFWHLFFNMYGVYIFGKMLLSVLGSRRFLILYFFSGIIGALLWLLANLHSFDICIGASGALFGLLVASALAFPDAKIILLIPPIPLKLRTFAIIYCLLELVLALGSKGNIAHLAHLGGALGGFLYMRRLGCPVPFADSLSNWWRKRQRHTPDADINPENPSTKEINHILDRISEVGYDGLTEQEKAALKTASDNLRSRE